MKYPYYRVQIEVNWNSLKSIRKAEKLKAKCENAGYTLIETYGGITTSTLVYAKKD